MNIKIAIAAHKKYQMPTENCYVPIQVGSKGKEDIGYIRDDTGNNISDKNPKYCELTAMYWMWKNMQADYYGLVHYRRHFSANPIWQRFRKDKFSIILTEKQALKILDKYDMILPPKRNYVIETIYSHYSHTHYKEHLDKTRNILKKTDERYVQAFDIIMNSKTAYMFNMFVMKKKLFSQYCEWLFPILKELEKQVNSSEYDSFQKRYIGRISEILLNVWILENDVSYKETAVINMEKINWGRKLKSFFSAKFLKKRYEGSF